MTHGPTVLPRFRRRCLAAAVAVAMSTLVTGPAAHAQAPAPAGESSPAATPPAAAQSNPAPSNPAPSNPAPSAATPSGAPSTDTPAGESRDAGGTPRRTAPPSPAAPSAPSAPAQPSTPTLQKETVTGGRLSDTDERRFSTASKLVFGREELDRYGDSTLGDVLKRLPGVVYSGVPGRGGDIRMRGLGRGYTMILINGEPAPRGFAIDSLSPDQVERIEIYRAPVAEHSARAVAGTINIILKEDLTKRESEARVTLAHERTGVILPNVSLQKTDKLDTFSYNVSANAGYRRHTENDSLRETTAIDTSTGNVVLHQLVHSHNESNNGYFSGNGQLNWRLGAGDSFTLTPFLNAYKGASHGDTELVQDAGTRPAPYARSYSETSYDGFNGRVMGNWRQRFRDGGRLELRFNAGSFQNNSNSAITQRDAAGGLAHTIVNEADIRDASITQIGKYTRPLRQGNQFGTGWELEANRRRETASNVLDGVDTLAKYGDIDARTDRLALYAQDEWDVSPLWSMYGGLRWETIRTQSTTNLTSVSNRSAVASPLFHSVWKFDPESKDQVRLAISRTYKAPQLGQLTAIPQINTTYPVTEQNTPTNADSIGNPDLKPELAWGVDATIEHYFEAGGLVSMNVFRRNIDDLQRSVTTLETVSWSTLQRWVSRPRNVGSASSTGVELEFKARLDEVVASWPKINVRVNYSRYWSQVDGIPGPDNRLAQQPPWVANFGADYRMTSLPLSFGANLNLTPGYTVTEAIGQQYFQQRKRVADAYVLWKVNPFTQLRVSAANLYADNYHSGNREVFGTIDQRADTAAKSFRFYSARLEVKF